MEISYRRRSYIGLILTCTALILAGCGAIDSTYRSTKSGLAGLAPDRDAWNGHSYEELVRSWGEPSLLLELGDGRVAHTWVSQDGNCKQTFMVQDERIIGSSDTGCTK